MAEKLQELMQAHMMCFGEILNRYIMTQEFEKFREDAQKINTSYMNVNDQIDKLRPEDFIVDEQEVERVDEEHSQAVKRYEEAKKQLERY